MHWVDDTNAALFTDLYELTMGASYHKHGLVEPATFDLFVRRLPAKRGYLVACGLEQALDYLETFHFEEQALEYLATLELFDDSFLEHLGRLRFTGEVRAIPEGELAFPEEPLVSVTAPLIEAQLVETFLLNCIGFQTMIATKAVRIATACRGRPFVDFSARRDHGVDAALKAVRAAFIGGAGGTSLMLGSQTYGIDPAGTMAHSYVMRFGDEDEAFMTFARDFPGRAVLLIDTYDTEEGARRVVRLADRLRREGALPRGVRLDSGDVDRLSRAVRRILDEGGLDEMSIFASGDLDEYRITELVEAGAPIDAFGVGTQLGTSGDASHLDVVSTLVEDVPGLKPKLSPGKVLLPGRKQVFRVASEDTDGALDHDVIALHDEVVDEGRPLLERVMVDGRRTSPAEPLPVLADRTRASLDALPERLRRLEPEGPAYEVRRAAGLVSVATKMRADHANRGEDPAARA